MHVTFGVKVSRKLARWGVTGVAALALTALPAPAQLSGATARLPLALSGRSASSSPTGLGPPVINRVYRLHPGGAGQVIMVIGAYDYKSAASDLAVFSHQYGLPQLPGCQAGVALDAQSCFEVADPQGAPPVQENNWRLEDALDIEWAHAEAPNATIVLVQALSDAEYPPQPGMQPPDLVRAAGWAGRHGATEVSMSWGLPALGNNFSAYESYIDHPGVLYTTGAGDFGSDVWWPAESPNVLAVGGTTLVGCSGTTCGPTVTEVAWSDSGGGISANVGETVAQKSYTGPVHGAATISALTAGKRGTPDVSFLADEVNGVSIYESEPIPPSNEKGWMTVGGTSVGAPVWAAIMASGAAAHDTALQGPAAIYGGGYLTNLFDVHSGTNGTCGTNCHAGKGYDLVTGLGSPRDYP